MNQKKFDELVAAIRNNNVLTPEGRLLFDCLAKKYPDGLEDHQLGDELHRGSQRNKVHNSDVRTAVYRVRSRLSEFYKYHPRGKENSQRLLIPPRAPYRLELVPNQQDLDPIERFWDSHFSNGADNLIVYTEPLFFWNEKERCYVRYLDLNDESPALETSGILSRLSADHPAQKLKPCFHYQPSGETHAQRHLRKWFEHQGVVEVKPSRQCLESEVWKCNIVLLGNNRTNRFIKKLQGSLKIVLDDAKITVKQHNDRPGYERFDLEPSLKELSGSYVYAAVTRVPSLAEERSVTIIAANHGRAIEKLAESLTSKTALDVIYDQVPFDRSAPLPSYFQLLFRIQMIDYESAPAEPKVVDYVIESRTEKASVAR